MNEKSNPSDDFFSSRELRLGQGRGERRPHQTEASRFAAPILIGVSGGFVSIAIPGIILALLQRGGFTADRTAMFASVELAGTMLSILLIGQLLNGRYRKPILAVALATIIIGNIFSAFVLHSNVVFLLRLMIGFGEGIALSALGAAATAFANPDRLFALFMSTNLGLVTVYLFFLPMIVLAGGVESAFYFLAILGLLGLLALPYFPSYDAPGTAVSHPTDGRRLRGCSARTALGLAGCLGLNTGVGTIWPFMGSLGKARGIAADAISSDLALATFAGIAAGFCAAFLGLRLGRRLPLALATLGLVLSSIGLVSVAIEFSLSAILFVFFWTVATSYFMGTVAAAEDGDRAAILIPATQLGGLALGPQLSAAILSHLPISWIVIVGGIICTISAILAFVANSLSPQIGKQ